MAFFNLTHLGTQDPFETASENVERAPDIGSGDGNEHHQLETPRTEMEYKEGEARDDSKSPEGAQDSSSSPGEERVRETETRTGQMDPAFGGPSWHKGSHVKYTEMLRKHQRNPKGPTDLYTQPLTTSQVYGWWMKHGSPQKDSWTQNKRRAMVNSEMTRFVDEMSLTNKEFSLY